MNGGDSLKKRPTSVKRIPGPRMMALPSRFFCAPMAELTTPPCAKPSGLRRRGRAVLRDAFGRRNRRPFEAQRAPYPQARFRGPFVYQIVGTEAAVMADAARSSRIAAAGRWTSTWAARPPTSLRPAPARGCSRTRNRARRSCALPRGVSIKLSVKMRAGYDSSDPVRLVEFARMLESEGWDHITLHPRHGRLGFRRKADWKLVALLKKSLGVPVIGNGDITSPAGAVARLRETGCDAVMIGREAVKSPWIFMLCTELLAAPGRAHHRRTRYLHNGAPQTARLAPRGTCTKARPSLRVLFFEERLFLPRAVHPHTKKKRRSTGWPLAQRSTTTRIPMRRPRHTPRGNSRR